jgi:hypothetical protein
MKYSLLALALCIAVCASMSLGQTKTKLTTVQGVVVDLGSYIQYGMKPDTEDRKGVAEASAKAGNPLGILEKNSGRLFVVIMNDKNANADTTLLPYLGINIFAKGKVFKRGSMYMFLLSDIGKSAK